MNGQNGNKPAAGYPSRVAFFAAVEKRAFRDPILRQPDPRQCRVQRSQEQEDAASQWPGAVAAVFKLIVGGETRAVRIYLNEQHVQRSQAHYLTLQEYFQRSDPPGSWHSNTIRTRSKSERLGSRPDDGVDPGESPGAGFWSGWRAAIGRPCARWLTVGSP